MCKQNNRWTVTELTEQNMDATAGNMSSLEGVRILVSKLHGTERTVYLSP